MRIPKQLFKCVACGRDLISEWEKPGDLEWTVIITLPADDGADINWCADCYFAKFPHPAAPPPLSLSTGVPVHYSGKEATSA